MTAEDCVFIYKFHEIKEGPAIVQGLLLLWNKFVVYLRQVLHVLLNLQAPLLHARYALCVVPTLQALPLLHD
jgi:hypothetical protein